MSTSRFHEHLDSRSEHGDILGQIREATCAPSPLTSYLKDPVVMNAIDSPEKGRTRRQRQSRTSSVLGVVLAEEERQAHKLKSLLRATGDRLEREMRQGKQAVARAEQAERRVEELSGRVSKAESGKYVVELEAARAKEEIKRYKLQIENLERDVKRLQGEVSLLERQRDEADESAARARDTARKYEMAVRKMEAREEGMMVWMERWWRRSRD